MFQGHCKVCRRREKDVQENQEDEEEGSEKGKGVKKTRERENQEREEKASKQDKTRGQENSKADQERRKGWDKNSLKTDGSVNIKYHTSATLDPKISFLFCTGHNIKVDIFHISDLANEFLMTFWKCNLEFSIFANCILGFGFT